MLLQMVEFHFLSLSGIPSRIYAMSSLSIHLLMDTYITFISSLW